MDEMVCITCPMGCHLKIERLSEGEIAVTGNRCAPRGAVRARGTSLPEARRHGDLRGEERPGHKTYRGAVPRLCRGQPGNPKGLPLQAETRARADHGGLSPGKNRRTARPHLQSGSGASRETGRAFCLPMPSAPASMLSWRGRCEMRLGLPERATKPRYGSAESLPVKVPLSAC